MPRADELATLYFFRPLRKWLRPKGPRVPILMYHSVSEQGAEKYHPYYGTVTSPAVFARQMKYLHENGYRAMGLSEAVETLEPAGPGTAKPVAITFDDGFRDFHTEAAPVLKRYGFCATMYLPTGWIDEGGREFKGKPCLTWGEVRELQREGMHFGSHTVTHPQLTQVGAEEARTEVRRSKETMEDRLGVAVKSFAYPYAFPETDGEFRRKLRGYLEEAGYENGVSTMIGTAGVGSDRFFLERLPVNSFDGLELFRSEAGGGVRLAACGAGCAEEDGGKRETFASGRDSPAAGGDPAATAGNETGGRKRNSGDSAGYTMRTAVWCFEAVRESGRIQF